MRIFGLGPCREVGVLKGAIKDAILDGIIPNERHAALDFLLERAREMGLSVAVPEALAEGGEAVPNA